MRRTKLTVLLLALLLLLCSCAQQAAEPTADERYAAARAQLDAGLYYAAAVGFEQIASHKDAAQLADYAHACLLMEDGFYAAAQARFSGLTVLDSAARAALCGQHVDYAAACELLSAGKAEEALVAFTALGNFGDSQAQAENCQAELNRVAYADAQMQLTSGDYAGAAEAFAALGNYADAAQLADYARACVLLAEGDAAAARALLTELSGVLDADALLAYCDADALAASGDVAGAEAAFAALTVLDSADRVMALRCQLAKEAYDAGDFVQAAEMYAACDGWGDSHVLWQMAVYQQAQGRLAHRDVSGATVLLEQIPGYGNVATQLTELAAMNVDTYRHTYDDVYLGFSEGLARVTDVDTRLYGFIDSTGYLVVPCRWKNASYFSEGLAVVQDDSGLYGFIDMTGALVIPCQYSNASVFMGGVAPVQQGSTILVINPAGEIVATMPAGMEIVRQEEGFLVGYMEGWYGCVDMTGQVIVPFEWDKLGYCADGLMLAQKGEKNYFIRPDGTVAFELLYRSEDDIFSDGMLSVTDPTVDWKSRRYGYINTSGELVVPFQWSSAGSFSEGLAAVRDENGLYGYINTSGELVIPCMFESAGEFTADRAVVKLNGTNVYIDQTGTVVIEKGGYQFEEDGIARVKVGWSDEQYIDVNGNPITPVFDYGSAPGGGFIILYSEEDYITVYDYQGNRLF